MTSNSRPMSNGYFTMTPEALTPLVDILCGNDEHFERAIKSDLATLLEPRLACGYLASAFTTSSLGYNGCPIEFSLTSATSDVLACTYDPVLPHAPALYPNKLPEHFSTVFKTSNNPTAPNFQLTDRLQSSNWNTLKFGTWFGRKYSNKGVTTKIYSEALPDNDLRNNFSLVKRLETCGLTLLMAGYYPENIQSPVEYYFEWHSAVITLADIQEITAAIEQPQFEVAFPAYIAKVLSSITSDGVFPQTTYGISLTLNHIGDIQNITLFTMAPRFLGAEQSATSALLTLSKQLNLPMPRFEKLSEQEVPIQLNVLGFSLDLSGHISLNCTFSPCTKRFEPTFRKVTSLSPNNPPSSSELSALLARYQAKSGAFQSYVKVPGGRRYRDENGFVTAQVLRTLTDKSSSWPPVQRALDFLQTCEIDGGRYSFWPHNAHPSWMKAERIAPDIDDTVVITELLYRFGRISFEQLQQTLFQINGYQVTCVDPRQSEPQHQWANCQSFYTWMTPAEDITQLDCCVNTNVLIFLHLYQQVTQTTLPASSQILNMLPKALTWSHNQYNRLSTLIPYYAHPNEWLSALLYAQTTGVPELNTLITSLTKWRYPSEIAPLPLYRRHDGRYLWSSSYLGQLRTMAQLRHQATTSQQGGAR